MTTNNQTNEQLAGDRAELTDSYHHMMSEEELRLWSRRAAALLEADAQRSGMKPLTDEQIAAAMTDFGATGLPFRTVVRFFRACEAAHGIKEQP